MRAAVESGTSEREGIRTWCTSTRRGFMGAGRAMLVLAATAVSTSGCASTKALLKAPGSDPLPFDSPVASRTLDPRDAWLRHHLMLADPASALSYVRPNGEPRIPDTLLQSLQEAIVARSAGDFVMSNALLEDADLEIERRKVLSVSQTAGSYLVSDRLLSYLPAAGERAMIPFYRMMNYLALGDPMNAAVEARRIGALVDGRAPQEFGECREKAMLSYASAAVFEIAGEMNDALVSLRRADETISACETGAAPMVPALAYDISRVASSLGILELVDSASSHYLNASVEPSPADGEVLVLVEHGFVAHRSEGSIHVPIYDDELEELAGDDGAAVADVAAAVTARLLSNFSERGYYGASWDDSPVVQVGQALGGAHIVRLAWPELRGGREEPVQLRVLAADDTVSAPALSDLSAIARQALNAERAASLTRLVTRGLTKFLAARAIEARAEKEGGELLGFVAARLSNLAGNATERADTRGWTLLPRQISLARLTLPAGEQELKIQSYDPTSGSWTDVDLGIVTVAQGKITVVSRRVWSDDQEEETWEGVQPGLHDLRRPGRNHQLPVTFTAQDADSTRGSPALATAVSDSMNGVPSLLIVQPHSDRSVLAAPAAVIDPAEDAAATPAGEIPAETATPRSVAAPARVPLPVPGPGDEAAASGM